MKINRTLNIQFNKKLIKLHNNNLKSLKKELNMLKISLQL